MTVRHLITALLGALVALTAVLFLRPTSAPANVAERSAGLDWSKVSTRELNIAAVFLTARESGIRPALDSLEKLAATDAQLEGMGHVLAHALGRFAIAQSKDVAILAQCREIFQAGCYHGVLEGYLAEQPEPTAQLVASICAPVAQAHSARLPALECAHGLGHGILGRMNYAIAPSAALCEALADAESQRECLDGLFMEYVVHGTGGVTVNVGDAAVALHQHGSMTHDAVPRTYFHANDLAFPCDSVAAAYQPSCWSYQPNAIMTLTKNDLARTIGQCDSAPSASRAACYGGIGKQSMGWFGWNHEKQVSLCQHGAEDMLAACVAGGVEAFIDRSWNSEGAMSYCADVPAVGREACYATIGARMRLVAADGGEVWRACEAAPVRYRETCRRGGERESREEPRASHPAGTAGPA